MEKQRKGIDIISQLPDELLIRILSLLPDADATRSRILSNRWKHLWAFLPNLHFVMPKFKDQANKFNHSVDQILALRGGMPIQKFFLQFSYSCNDYRVYKWFRIITRCKIEELEFRFLPDDTYYVTFYWDLFRTCSNTLTKLTFEGSCVLVTPVVEIHFPCLKKLNLLCMEFSDENLLMDLISWCPVLEELCLDRLTCNSHMVIMVSSPSMKRLTIKSSKLWDQELVIDAPKLEYFHLMSCYFRRHTLVNPKSLVETHISNRTCYVIQLLRFISSTKILTLTRESLLALGGFWRYVPMFPNLVKLEIAWVRNLLLVLLNNMPNLAYLTFSDGLLSFKTEWNPPKEDAPVCLRFKLKEIFIVSYVTRKEFAIISYLMKHANNLEKLRIGDVDPDRREPWLNIHRASKSCRIEFI